jgi:hypothetical protein
MEKTLGEELIPLANSLALNFYFLHSTSDVFEVVHGWGIQLRAVGCATILNSYG